jgi:hypothetical protein
VFVGDPSQSVDVSGGINGGRSRTERFGDPFCVTTGARHHIEIT